MKEVYDKIYGLYNEILKLPKDSPKYFELYKEYIKLLILVSSNNPSFNDDVKKYIMVTVIHMLLIFLIPKEYLM